MKTALYKYYTGSFVQHPKSENVDAAAVQLVLAFGAKSILQKEEIYTRLREQFPHAQLTLCSTAGEIYGDTVSDNSVSVTAVQFSKTRVNAVQVNIQDFESSYDAGIAILESLQQKDLAHVLVFSDGNLVNGSELVRGMNTVKEHATISGGLAGDGNAFRSTLTGLNTRPRKGNIIGIGFYGKELMVASATKSGWDMFGRERTVTRSNGNELFELDGTNALDLYKTYLGAHAADLPGSALHFPLTLVTAATEEPVVRTILKINEVTGSMTFAGDLPEGAQVRFMKANFDRLIDAATTAAETITQQNNGASVQAHPQLAILVSCVGRKLLLGPRIEEEVEAVHNTFSGNTLLSGFYSYGEISPSGDSSRCNLHNQTMAITTFSER